MHMEEATRNLAQKVLQAIPLLTQFLDAVPFDVVVSRALPHYDPAQTAELVAAYADAGVTWLLRDTLLWEVSLD
jgi:hypothetical protein